MKALVPFAICCLGSAAAAQSQLVEFSAASGLACEAEFTLVGGGSSLEIRYRNTSTGTPVGFNSSDQLLTSVSWDFGGVATMLGGSAVVGPLSTSVNFDGGFGDFGPGQDVSGEFGFGNGGTTGLHPHFVGSNMSGLTPFGGPNLDGPDVLDGPQAGLVANPAVVALGGLGAIQDEVVITVQLDATLTNLDFLDNGVTAEFGSDAAFLDGTPVCAPGSNTLVNDTAGLNLAGSLTASSEPFMGNLAYSLCMDDAADACGMPAGTPTLLFLSRHTLEFVFAGLGCAPGAPGTIMLNLTAPYAMYGPVIWNGPGSPACYTVPLPDDPSLCGFTCSGQGLFLGSGPSGLVLTNRQDLIIGG
ncbi:MAG: XDD4 family exosortase-dependent surface protein [Planctomycetota bacterium]